MGECRLPCGVVVLDVVEDLVADDAHEVLEAQRRQPWQQPPHDGLSCHHVHALQQQQQSRS